MRIRVVTLLLTLILSGSTSVFGQATGSVLTMNRLEKMADTVFVQIVRNHPDKEMVYELDNWFHNKRVMLSYSSDRLPPEMATELVMIQGELKPVLVVNPVFVLREHTLSETDETKYNQLVLYHEYIHLKNHLSGSVKMLPGNFDKRNAKEHAENLWKSEWSAVGAEWKFAQKISATHLMPDVKEYTSKYGEKKGFLEAFYLLIMSNPMGNGRDLLKETWYKLYQEEKKKVP